jgi:hypothetical protein
MAQTGYTPIQLYYSSTTTNVPLAANLANGELAINITDGKLFYKDNSAAVQVIGWKTVPTSAGGTGLISYTAGDLPYYASGSALSKLGIGTNGYVLQSNGSAPTWVAQSTLSVGTATNATNTAITDNTSSSATWYPTIVSATTGNLPQTTSSTKLSFVPSTGILTATGFSGALNGAVGATTPSTGAFTTITASSTITPNSTAGIVGTTTNDNTQTGSVGEYVVSSVPSGSRVSMTSGASPATVTSISLTAGDWDVSGNFVAFLLSSTLVQYLLAGISTGSTTFSFGDSVVGTGYTTGGQAIGAYTNPSFAIPVTRVSLSSTTTIYFNAQVGFTVTGLEIYGAIRARRVR